MCPRVVIYAIFVLVTLVDVVFMTGLDNFGIYDTISSQEYIDGDVFFEIIDPRELQYTYRVRPAKDFGSSFTSNLNLRKAALVPTIPSDGCKDVKNAADIRGNVALIERGECSFLDKTINAERLGAKAAIITESATYYNDVDYYIEMVHDDTGRDANIPAGFLLGKNGRMIQSTLQKLRKKYAVINLPLNLTFTPLDRVNHPPWLGW